MEDKLLPLIIDYDMNKTEAKAWKIAILYLDLAQKHFPDYQHYRLGKGDPRKTNLFRHCYKLVRECDGLLEDHEYRMYVSAQLQILKHIDCGECHAHVGPNCLVGPKAWKRWLVWKKRFERQAIVQTQEEAGVLTHQNNKIADELKASKTFLLSKFSELTRKVVIDSLDNRTLFRWVAMGYVSPYYLVLSPVVKTWIDATKADLLESFAIDLSFYRAGIDSDLELLFRKEFAYEF